MAKQNNAAAAPVPALGVAPMPMGAFLRKLGDRCLRAFAEWLAHSLLLFGIIAVIEGLHWCLTNILGIPADKKFFDVVPMAYLFDGADLALLVGVAIVGVTAVVRSYLGKHV